MSPSILSLLQELKPQSNLALNPVIIARIQNHELPLSLVRRELVSNGKWVTVPRGGTESLRQDSNRRAHRKIRKLSDGAHGNLMFSLNSELLGGESFPILTAVLGAGLGAVSSGAGLIFSAASTGYDAFRKSHRVLARDGDEIWQIEEIGKVPSNGGFKAIYVSSFFIVDPFRAHYSSKGWLIHESRHDLSL